MVGMEAATQAAIITSHMTHMTDPADAHLAQVTQARCPPGIQKYQIPALLMSWELFSILSYVLWDLCESIEMKRYKKP